MNYWVIKKSEVALNNTPNKGVTLKWSNAMAFWIFSVNTDIHQHTTFLKFGWATQFHITVNSSHHHSWSADCFVTLTFLWLSICRMIHQRWLLFPSEPMCLAVALRDWAALLIFDKLSFSLPLGWVNNQLIVTLTEPCQVTRMLQQHLVNCTFFLDLTMSKMTFNRQPPWLSQTAASVSLATCCKSHPWATGCQIGRRAFLSFDSQ